MRLRKRNDLCLIHLVHGIGDLGCVLLSSKPIKEIAKQKQSASEGKETYEDEHGGWPSRGTPSSISGTSFYRNERFGLAGETKLATLAQIELRHDLPDKTRQLLLHYLLYGAGQ